MDELKKISEKLEQFAVERDWNQFHSPKNLAMALSVEVAELVEIFQWLTDEQCSTLSSEKREDVKDEIGDILNYLIRISSKLHIDPIAAAHDKIKKNEKKYPVSKSKGSMKKYTEFDK